MNTRPGTLVGRAHVRIASLPDTPERVRQGMYP